MRGRRLPSLGVAPQQPAGAAGQISHVGASLIGQRFLRAPTILAWDLATVCRILPIEARSP
jgi:hypothetical protein